MNKDKCKILENKDLVYKLECIKCEACYIGQTERLLDTRCTEHKNTLKRNKKYHNVVTKHITDFSEEKDDMDWDNVKILHTKSNWKKRCVAEMHHIKKEKHSIIEMTDLEEFPRIYSTVLK